MDHPANPNIVSLTVTRESADFILASLAEHPHKVVGPLVAELQAQIRMQDATRAAHAEAVQAASNAHDAAAVVALRDGPAASSRPTRRERRALRKVRGK